MTAPTTEIVVTREGTFAALRARPAVRPRLETTAAARAAAAVTGGAAATTRSAAAAAAATRGATAAKAAATSGAVAATSGAVAATRGAAAATAAAAAATAAPVVVLLHGFPDHPPTFAGVIEELAAGGLEVIAPWMRGYAPSMPGGPYDPRQLAADAIAVADAVAGDRPAYLVGHDWGAVATYAACTLAPGRFRAAVAMAVPHPLAFVRSLVTTGQLARSWYMLAFQLPGATRAVAARDLAFVDWLWRRWSPGFELAPDARAELHACLAASLPAPLDYYRALLRPSGLRVFLGPGGRARRIVTPLLHVQGARDGCVAPAACRGQERFFAGPFQSAVVPGVGHFLQAEDPRGTAAQILHWFATATD